MKANLSNILLIALFALCALEASAAFPRHPYRHNHYRHSCRPAPVVVIAPPRPMPIVVVPPPTPPQRVWVEGYWRYNRWGKARWMPGYWTWR